MKQLILLLITLSASATLWGQSAIFITNTFQDRAETKRHVTTKLLDAAREEVNSSQHQNIIAYNCSGDGLHYSQGKAKAIEQLDLLFKGIIPLPLTESIWKMERNHLLEHLIQSDFVVNGKQLDVHIYSDHIDKEQLKRDLLKPLALSFDLLDNKGGMMNTFTITVHHKFSSNDGYNSYSINSL